MTRQELITQIKQKRSFLCVGLDPELERIPTHLHGADDPVFEFNKVIIDATKDLCVAYKPNLAFYESQGSKGWATLEKTLDYIPSDCFTIADAKRGDIGNTSRLYAKAFFETFDFDAITVAPYMGSDSVEPFLEFSGKWVILLGLTSNKGSADFQLQATHNGEPLYAEVLRKAQEWGSPDNLMFVIGATHPSKLAEIREIAPDHFFLVPGVGAQGGDLQAVMRYGMNANCGLLVNSSRGIIYAGKGEDFGEKARAAAEAIQKEMGDKIGA
ncbi:MAG: orotidine-5'-phosphate decarboxylase [Saprospirales bacterium]|nr:orotidine-5'-phosphate decarboxylase [Saprospirales bacterium]